MKFFKIEELIKSRTANIHGIDNRPGNGELKNLITLVDNVLDPLRMLYGKPILVNSAYRCRRLNTLVGGSKTSQHLTGQAADIQTVGDKDNLLLFELAKTLDYDQLIFEYGTDSCPDWVHVSYVSKEKNRHQILRARKSTKGTIYEKLS